MVRYGGRTQAGRQRSTAHEHRDTPEPEPGGTCRSWRYALVCILCTAWCILGSFGAPSLALGATLTAPAGGASFLLPDGRVVCGELLGGWTVDARGTRLRPPQDSALVGRSTIVRVAPNFAGCSNTKDTDTLVVTGPIPQVDQRTADLWLDEAHLDVRGTNLDGTHLEWEANGERGSDRCIPVTRATGQQLCSYAINRSSNTDLGDVTLRILPAGASRDAMIHDHAGRLLDPATLSIIPARLILSRSVGPERHLDLSTGEGRLPLSHPNVVASVDCDAGECDVLDGRVRVRSVTGTARTLSLRVRLKPRAFVRSGDNFVQAINVPLSVTYCPITLVSPPPLRDTDDVRIVVRIDARCSSSEDGLRWTANGNGVPVVATESVNDFVYVLLHLGRITMEKLTVAALRNTADASAIGFLSIPTQARTPISVTLNLTGYGEIDFIPTNRGARVSATAPNLDGKIVVLPVEGAYDVKAESGHTEVRGTAKGGFVVLRFALRNESLPGHLAQADLAHFTSYVQRAIRQVNVPAPVGAVGSKSPIVEVLCTDEDGKPISVIPGVPLHIPFSQRNGCRLLVHPSRIAAEDGEQRLDVEISLTSLGGVSRGEGHFAQRLVLSHESPPRIVWIRGVQAQFDRITVQVTHVTEDQQYIQKGARRVEIPAATWTIVVENTRWRFYARVTIPVQLYRFSSDANGSGTGPLSLNFGVLTRFTWVPRDGAEGFLGRESGGIGMGLASTNTRQLNLVGGIGIGVPLGNVGQPTQASINIHAWVAYRLGDEYAPRLDARGVPVGDERIALKPWAFIFGPSITFGNVGFDI